MYQGNHHHCSIEQSYSPCPPKNPISCSSQPQPQPLAAIRIFSVPFRLAFPRMSHTWNHTWCSLLSLASFAYQNVSETHPCRSCICQFFLFMTEQNPIAGGHCSLFSHSKVRDISVVYSLRQLRTKPDKHFHPDLRVNLSFPFTWVNTQEQDFWVVLVSICLTL